MLTVLSAFVILAPIHVNNVVYKKLELRCRKIENHNRDKNNMKGVEMMEKTKLQEQTQQQSKQQYEPPQVTFVPTELDQSGYGCSKGAGKLVCFTSCK